MSLKNLNFLQTKRQHNIIREFTYEGFIFDGFIQETREVFESYGCYFHGCLNCFPNKRNWTTNTLLNKSMEDLFENTIERENKLKADNFPLLIHLSPIKFKISYILRHRSF